MSMEERKMLGTRVQPHQLPTVTTGLQTDSEPGQEQMSVSMILNLSLCEIKTGVEPRCGNLSDFLLESDNAKTTKVFRRKQCGFVETALDLNLSLVSNSKTGFFKKRHPSKNKSKNTGHRFQGSLLPTNQGPATRRVQGLPLLVVPVNVDTTAPACPLSARLGHSALEQLPSRPSAMSDSARSAGDEDEPPPAIQ
ncbi:hypothetical protein MJT46_010030 [Ovis ammon polii x Ovis aries]|nr:hypothetical protein MJT46_010030 [Ovis ammon polii x Ovis aries]